MYGLLPIDFSVVYFDIVTIWDYTVYSGKVISVLLIL